MEFRPRLNQEEWNLIQSFREQKSAFHDECREQGINPNDVKHYWWKGKHFSINVRGKQYSPQELVQDLTKIVAEHAPRYSYPKRTQVKDPHALIIDPADVHIGKLAYFVETGENYNIDIATERVREGVAGILNKSAGFNIDQIYFIIGNDILHADNPRNTTTSGTYQDFDGLWHNAFLIAQTLYVDIIEQLREYAPVQVVFNPSNHDFQSGWALAQVLKAWFRHSDIQVDADIKHRKYFQYGNSLIGTSHGDGAKMDDLHNLMAVESGQSWVDCDYKYWYLHHIHHKTQYRYLTAKDKIGVSIEYLRSPSAPDRWHFTNGYTGAPKAIEGFVHSKDRGQIARFSHFF